MTQTIGEVPSGSIPPCSLLGRTRRRRLLDAHGRVAACSWPGLQWSLPTGPAFLLAKLSLPAADSVVGSPDDSRLCERSSTAIDRTANALCVGQPFRAASCHTPVEDARSPPQTNIDRCDTLRLNTPPPAGTSPFRCIRFFLCDDIEPAKRAMFADWIASEGAVLVHGFSRADVDLVIGDKTLPDDFHHVAVRSSAWLSAVRSFPDPSALSRGDLQNDLIRTVSLQCDALISLLIRLGQHHVAHQYAQALIAIQQHYENSAADDAALREPAFLEVALHGSGHCSACARRLLLTRPPAAVRRQILSNDKLVAIAELTQRTSVSVSLARRLYQRHRDLDRALRALVAPQNRRPALKPRPLTPSEAEAILRHLRRHLPPNCQVTGCGAFRRRCSEILAISISVTTERGDLGLDDVERFAFRPGPGDSSRFWSQPAAMSSSGDFAGAHGTSAT